MLVVSYHVGFLSGLLAPFATLRSLLEAGGSTSKTLNDEKKQFACIVTTDIDAGEGAVSALSSNGFKSRVQFCDGFDFIDDLTS